jgi:c-di-GMP phosphodiesterase
MQIFFARQPIFDRSRRLVAYEQLYRPGPDAGHAAGDASTDRMSAQVLVDAIATVGLDVAAAGVPAYVNLSRGLLVDGPIDLIDR